MSRYVWIQSTAFNPDRGGQVVMNQRLPRSAEDRIGWELQTLKWKSDEPGQAMFSHPAAAPLLRNDKSSLEEVSIDESSLEVSIWASIGGGGGGSGTQSGEWDFGKPGQST
ncbi:hypothetical protein C8R44DRAFT_738122 [Mycena epipterygia]|nr:hypothetical protein C8R44DRAFT_738122 [Mycena epipterygia]